MGIILSLKHAKGIPRRALSYLMGVCALNGFLGFASTIVLDRHMYGFWAIPVLGNINFNVIQGMWALVLFLPNVAPIVHF